MPKRKRSSENSDNAVIVFDTETTGFLYTNPDYIKNYGQNRVIDAAFIKIKDTKPVTF